jgi:glucose-6-phosphate 1-dehydrogenase
MSKKPTILIIFGISGDLSKRYLLPAIEAIAKAKMLPEDFHIVGITRQKDIDLEKILKKTGSTEHLGENIELFKMNVSDKDDYGKLNDHLNKIEEKFKEPAQRLFYLVVPPEACKNIIEFIGKSSLVKIDAADIRNKLLLEKPFGSNLESAKELVTHIDKYFKPGQVYRTDHYMAKEAAQNLIVFRERNSLFKKTWNKDFIESISITASEEIDIEGRVNFYEQTGALRDVVQSHLLQLAALTLMELPTKEKNHHEKLEEVPGLRYKALKQLNIVCDVTKNGCVKRGQYEGYRSEVGNNESMTETFVSVVLQSGDPNWRGVPITLSAGKAFQSKFTEIKITYKKDEENESNELVIRIQPNAGIELCIWTKSPGYEFNVSRHAFHFLYKEHFEQLPEAYEQVLYNAINSDHSLFTSSEEILESWRILDEVQKTWKNSKENLIVYKKGSIINEVVNT